MNEQDRVAYVRAALVTQGYRFSEARVMEKLIGAPWREDVGLAAAKALEDAGVAQCRIA